MDPNSTADGLTVPAWAHDLVCAESDALHSALKRAVDVMDEVAPLGDTVPAPSLAERIRRLGDELNECLDELGSITLAVDGLVESDGTALERVNELVAKYDSLRKHCDALREYNQRLDAAVSGSASEWMREREALRSEVARLREALESLVERARAVLSATTDHSGDADKKEVGK